MTAPQHTRPIHGCLFSNEKNTTPVQVGMSRWDAVVRLHQQRAYRPSKSGRMFGAYALSGTRSDNNASVRSLLQLDIDTEGEKDKATGQILTVTKPAPPLSQVRSGIDEFEWVAASSHWHEPGRGVIKYRITILLDRDIAKEEFEALMEAVDEALGGVSDRNAWQWSQAFYLPSCPQPNAADAFFEHNVGRALPVDEFIARGEQIIAMRQAAAAGLGSNTGNSRARALPDTPESEALVRSMLAFIDPDIARKYWLRIVWSILASGLSAAAGIAREWSQLGNSFTEKDFRGALASFNPNKGTGVGTLFHFAKQNGWVDPTVSADDSKADIRNGRLFAAMFRGKLLHVHETGQWLAFDSKVGWLAAAPGEVDRAAKAVVQKLTDDAAKMLQSDPNGSRTRHAIQHVARSSIAKNVFAMIEMAKSEPGMTVQASEFDAEPMLLGVANGVLDLSTGTLIAVTPHVLVSKRCNVVFDPEADCPRFKEFLREVQPEKDVRAFLRRFSGYTLTGLSREHVFLFLHGVGRNGKSVFVETLSWLLGGYADKIPTEMLMHHQRSPQSASPDIVGLKGRRLVYANETEEGRRLAEARVKEMTGGDTLTGRTLFAKNFVTFTPTHKLIIAGNHRPEITDNSFGMWRRVILVPFEHVIPDDKRDPQLLEKLKGEGPGILNWALSGLRDYLRSGLAVPATIKAQSDAYRDEQDIIGEFVRDVCATGTGRSIAKTMLYFSYKSWCETNGHKPLAQGRLTRRLNERGYQLAPDKRTVTGIELAKPSQQPRPGIP